MIEVCSNGEFRLICGTTDGWNDKDAETACRELGHNPHGTSMGKLHYCKINAEIFQEAFNLRKWLTCCQSKYLWY